MLTRSFGPFVVVPENKMLRLQAVTLTRPGISTATVASQNCLHWSYCHQENEEFDGLRTAADIMLANGKRQGRRRANARNLAQQQSFSSSNTPPCMVRGKVPLYEWSRRGRYIYDRRVGHRSRACSHVDEVTPLTISLDEFAKTAATNEALRTQLAFTNGAHHATPLPFRRRSLLYDKHYFIARWGAIRSSSII